MVLNVLQVWGPNTRIGHTVRIQVPAGNQPIWDFCIYGVRPSNGGCIGNRDGDAQRCEDFHSKERTSRNHHLPILAV